MQRIPPGFILPSAALTVARSKIHGYAWSDDTPQVGDLVYGEIVRVGQHGTLENKHGRIHAISDGSRAIFVYGNRYAPDYYESAVPGMATREADLVARSGIVGVVRQKNVGIKDPTRVRVLGRALGTDGQALNTTQFPLIKTKSEAVSPRRSKLILVCGTAMNAGKSMAAAACCWALATMGHNVRATKMTGTASLKDILHMNDAGAAVYNDFTHLGWPSTYLLPEETILDVFDTIDGRYANNPRNYWVVELADGILQRETAMLLSSERVRSRIDRLIFCAGDALGCVGGLQVLKERFDLTPDAVSGVVSASPLAIREFQQYSDVPVFDSVQRDLRHLAEILLH